MMMSKLSHSNPYLDDVYVDGDEYRFENGSVYVKPEKEITEWQSKRLPKKRKLRERVGY